MSKIDATSYDQITNAATFIEEKAADYMREYNALYDHVAAMKSGYEGRDSDAFVRQLEGFRVEFERMKNKMEEYARHLRASAKRLDTTQTDLTTQATNLPTGK